MNRPRRLLLASLLMSAGLALGACSSPIPRRDPVGETFPTVAGESLEGEAIQLPSDVLEPGRWTVLLVGYVQDAQFDADRWLVGLGMADAPVIVREVPTIRGLFPRMIGNTIDAGMRKGIPSEDWSSVVTVYGDASAIAEFTGTEGPRNIRVLLLDDSGVVRWFHDRGFSAGSLLRMLDLVPEWRSSGD